MGKVFSTGEHFKHWNRLPKVVEKPPSLVFSRPCPGDHMIMWRSLAIPSSEKHWCHTRLLRAWSSHMAISSGGHCHHRGALQAPVQLAWVHFCIAPTLPAMPNLSSCAGSHHRALGTLHLVSVKPQEVPISPFLQLVEVPTPSQVPTVWYQHQCMVGYAISPSPICCLALAHPSPTDVFISLGRSLRQTNRDEGSGGWDVELL